MPKPRWRRRARRNRGGRHFPSRNAGRVFLRFHDLLLHRQDEVLDLIQLETGKARRHAFEEILDTAVVARYYARHSAGLAAPAPPQRGTAAAYQDVGIARAGRAWWA